MNFILNSIGWYLEEMKKLSHDSNEWMVLNSKKNNIYWSMNSAFSTN